MKLLLSILALLWTTVKIHAQGLIYSKPQVLAESFRSDNTPSIIQHENQLVLAWKESQSSSFKIGCLGNVNLSNTNLNQWTLTDTLGASDPVLVSSQQRLYLFWIAPNYQVKYKISNTPVDFTTAITRNLNTLTNVKYTDKLSILYNEGKIIIGSHGKSKKDIFIAIASIVDTTSGILGDATITPIDMAQSTVAPNLTQPKDASSIQAVWLSSKDKKNYTSVLNLETMKWAKPLPVSNEKTTSTAYVFEYKASQCDYFFWSYANKSGNGITYKTVPESKEHNFQDHALPTYFKSKSSLNVSPIDDRSFLLSYIDNNNQLNISTLSCYNTESWIKDLLLPTKSNYSIRDIVIPGSHDAGMSILTAVGGKVPGSINECNTLTQKSNIKNQLSAGVRMFDLRIDQLNNDLYLKHSSSDCMSESIGGGWGEKLSEVLKATKSFLQKNNGEFVILNFSHFCEQNMSIANQAKYILDTLGSDYIYYQSEQKLADIKLNDIKGKAIVVFETYSFPEWKVYTGATNDKTDSNPALFLNYKREYAATNNLEKLITSEESFFQRIKDNSHSNDLIRLDWQLTQPSQEAAMVCNAFESSNANPLLDGVIGLTNALSKHKSIIDLAVSANKELIPKMENWISNGIITKENRPHILYVDVVGTWITDFCVKLNDTKLYNK